VDAEAVARRREWTEQRAWTGERVRETICIAWAAKPRTTEHTGIMLWPTLYLPTMGDLRIAIHMLGLHCSAPKAYPITLLVRERLGCKFDTWERRLTKGCAGISDALNSGHEPLVLRAQRTAQ
jgi:hypothetical protein